MDGSGTVSTSVESFKFVHDSRDFEAQNPATRASPSRPTIPLRCACATASSELWHRRRFFYRNCWP
ncbi:hypothetical protein BDV98DRAFT_572764 [Pterulicium gracile]|uniref:Uncharacterized protein n=1 Tax=Pterulicium gracile TaxID=1884261 RepID=A0A5C3Q916_9AGAR|nr:hypothetical protein BDV98DRAFT_572764 [Pterula gracilis]